MLHRLSLISAAVLVLGTPVSAGPCTDRIAEIEKSVTARHEGAGPTLSGQTTGATASSSRAADQDSTETMQMLQQAKELDRQGKEQDCMQIVTAVKATVPTGTK